MNELRKNLQNELSRIGEILLRPDTTGKYRAYLLGKYDLIVWVLRQYKEEK